MHVSDDYVLLGSCLRLTLHLLYTLAALPRLGKRGNCSGSGRDVFQVTADHIEKLFFKLPYTENLHFVLNSIWRNRIDDSIPG